MEAQPRPRGAARQRQKQKTDRCVQRLGHRSISWDLLAEIINSMKSEDETSISSTTLRHHFQTDMRNIKTPCGMLIETMDIDLEDGTTFETEFINPYALLYESCRLSARFGAMLKKFVYPSGGRLIVYTDGLTVGNQNNTLQGRQVQCVYWTLCGLPAWYTSRDHGWFTLVALPEDVISLLPWGMSSLCVQIMKKIFVVDGRTFKLIRLPIGGQGCQLRIILFAFLQELLVLCTRFWCR